MREVAPPGDLRVVIRDEVWKVMRLGVDAVKALDEDFRLSRGVAGKGGDIQWANAHKPSDMLTVGDLGSQAANIARDLMHLADVKILHGQKAGVAAELDTMLGLGPQATDAITGWAMQRRGRALWMVGERAYKVETHLHPAESGSDLDQRSARRRGLRREGRPVGKLLTTAIAALMVPPLAMLVGAAAIVSTSGGAYQATCLAATSTTVQVAVDRRRPTR